MVAKQASGAFEIPPKIGHRKVSGKKGDVGSVLKTCMQDHDPLMGIELLWWVWEVKDNFITINRKRYNSHQISIERKLYWHEMTWKRWWFIQFATLVTPQNCTKMLRNLNNNGIKITAKTVKNILLVINVGPYFCCTICIF